MERILILLTALLLSACGSSSQDASWLSNTSNLGTVEAVAEPPPSPKTEVGAEAAEPEVQNPPTASTPLCDQSTITYFDTVEEGLNVLKAFCGSSQAYADGVRLVNGGLGWDVKALYGMMAATGAYYGDDVDLSVASQIQAEAEAI